MPATLALLGLGLASLTSGAAAGWFGGNLPDLGLSASAMADTQAPQPPRAKSTSPVADGNSGPSDGASAPEGASPRTITILGVGDILIHKEILEQARLDGAGEVDFLPQLEGIRPLVEAADLAVCHMEYPLGSREGPWSTWPDPVNAPPQLADGLADLGFDVCSTASNHTLAQGFSGVTSTIDALESAGLPHAGTAASEEESRRITMLDVDGVPIAVLSYTYGFNGIPRPFDWCCHLIDEARIIDDATRARAEGARIVVVSLHHGVEGIVAPTAEQSATVEALAASGTIDLVLGHHAHVVQPVTRVGNMWVAYGHGNLLSAQSRRDPRTGDGLLTMFTFRERPDGRFDGVAATGYAIVNEDFPFRIYPVGDPATSNARAEGTWGRVSEQAYLADDASGFTLLRSSGDIAPAVADE